jgi:BMFP domain-containing protein YqiC
MTGDGSRGKFMDDLAGVAGGAFSVLAGLRNEAEAMARSQGEAMVRRLDLVKREELDAAMEVARRAPRTGRNPGSAAGGAGTPGRGA